MILGLNKESKNPGSAFNAHSVVPIQLGPTDPQVPLTKVEHKQHCRRYDDRVWPVAPTLGIGTTSPVSTLQVNGTTTTTALSSPSGSNLGINTAGGNVGIGTTNPGATLEVAGSGRFNADDTAWTYDAGGLSRVGFVKKSGFTYSMLAADSATPLVFGHSSVANLGGTAVSSQTLTANMTILTNGNVGIGTTSPAGTLDVAGTICLSGANCISSWPGAGGGTVSASLDVVGTGDGSGTATGGTLRGANITGTNLPGANLTIAAGDGTGTGGSGAINFQTAPASGTGATSNTLATTMTITAAGNVGIGTTTPAVRLDVLSSTSEVMRLSTVSGTGSASFRLGVATNTNNSD